MSSTFFFSERAKLKHLNIVSVLFPNVEFGFPSPWSRLQILHTGKPRSPFTSAITQPIQMFVFSMRFRDLKSPSLTLQPSILSAEWHILQPILLCSLNCHHWESSTTARMPHPSSPWWSHQSKMGSGEMLPNTSYCHLAHPWLTELGHSPNPIWIPPGHVFWLGRQRWGDISVSIQWGLADQVQWAGICWSSKTIHHQSYFHHHAKRN